MPSERDNNGPTKQEADNNDELGVVETIAIVRHLRWGYARYGLMWWIIAAGILFLEPRAAALGETFVWICSWAAWGAGLWGTWAFGVALFFSDKRLLESFKQQTRSSTMPTTLNQQLDEMGPSYRTIFGRLTRVLAMIEYAASQKPPRMTPAQFETAIDHLESSTALLKEAAKGEPFTRGE